MGSSSSSSSSSGRMPHFDPVELIVQVILLRGLGSHPYRPPFPLCGDRTNVSSSCSSKPCMPKPILDPERCISLVIAPDSAYHWLQAWVMHADAVNYDR
jgi:hypothetical protein